jgi:GWxTD domain-containing protein
MIVPERVEGGARGGPPPGCSCSRRSRGLAETANPPKLTPGRSSEVGGRSVRYIAETTSGESRSSTQEPDEIARFITEFWARRDPSPGTFENEYRRMFWTRVFDANRRFRSSTTPGWKTDRGKIYILLGEPDSIELNMTTNMTNRGGERWTYKRQFAKTTDPEFYVVFVQSPTN